MSDVPYCSLNGFNEEIQHTYQQDELAWSPLGLREHLQAHLQQSQQIGAIKILVDPHCKEEQDLSQSEQPQICCDTQQESNISAPRGMKSKRDILREKRDKKKQRAQERQIFGEEVMSKTERKEYENMTKEERAERQREKNRESAQLSRDRKKLKEDIMQKDLQFLTEENKQLQALLKKQFRCIKCGTLNKSQHDLLAETANSSTENNNVPLIEYNYKINTARDYHSSSCDSEDLPLTAEPQSPPLCEKSAGPASIYEFFDFQKAPHWSNCLNVSGQNHNIPHSGFTKGGAWSTTFVIFLLYMMILFPGPQQQNQENWGALEASLRQIQMIGPYSQIVEECRNLSQDQIFQKLLMNLNQLEIQEREEFHDSEAFQNETETNEKYQGEARIQQQQQRQKFWEFYKDYQDAEMKKEIENKHYYSEVSQKLEELQKEKLEQLEALKKLFNQTQQPETPCLSLEETRSQPGQQEQDCSYAFSQAHEFSKYNHIVDTPSLLSDNLIKLQLEDQIDYHALKEYDEFSSSQDSMMEIPPPDHPFIVEGHDKKGINYYEYLRREEALKQHNFYELQQPQQQQAYLHQVRHAVRPYAY